MDFIAASNYKRRILGLVDKQWINDSTFSITTATLIIVIITTVLQSVIAIDVSFI